MDIQAKVARTGTITGSQISSANGRRSTEALAVEIPPLKYGGAGEFSTATRLQK